MSLFEYFTWNKNWSFFYALVLVTVLVDYLVLLRLVPQWPDKKSGVLILNRYFLLRPSLTKLLSLAAALFLLYILLGSPLTHLLEFGLHSVAMLQQVVGFMIVPVLLWKAIPTVYLDKNFTQKKIKSGTVVSSWTIGIVAMWLAHFITAAKVSAQTGLAICGVSATPGSWIGGIHNSLILLTLLFAGFIFYRPIFSNLPGQKMTPLAKIAYLFTACVSCSILGIWVAFTASGAPAGAAAPYLTVLKSPLPMSLRTDQELAGMLMWVPGCVVYVSLCTSIAVDWLEGRSNERTIQPDRSVETTSSRISKFKLNEKRF